MKRCPQCEFIYEDDQSLCDMDGVLLVFDSRTLPNVHALATVSAPVPGKTQRRSRMVPAFATLIMMLVAASVYYVSTLRNAPQPEFSPASVTSTSTAEMPPAVPAEPTPDPNEVVQPTAPEPTPEVSEPRQTQPAHAAPKPAATAPAKKVTITTPVIDAKPAPKKDDSKVESILKKTGRILKKPFKF